ncbi:dynein light chain Tctex-type 5-B-like [Ylistrum balloti]|uniref:dynein light chain Tctex-type 5-B-like n=1 Tax=Ylistrum balloti TaxID=509963 RepID=UPI002905883B|nr:dynein light chain Tctex-type 5-B-like [Ylistrum balloti]
MATEKQLTMQALMDHDRVQPKFKAPKGPATHTSSTKEKKEDGEERRPRLTSTSESQKSVTTSKPSGMNFFKLVAATRAWQRLAKKRAAQNAVSKPAIQYENTYRLEPADGAKFVPSKVENIIKDILEARLRDFKYRAMFVKNLTTDLSNVINQRVKALGFPRYKFVCNVVIMENKDQGVEVASRCVWNPSTDNFATYTYRNATTIATAHVYGVYFE